MTNIKGTAGEMSKSDRGRKRAARLNQGWAATDAAVEARKRVAEDQPPVPVQPEPVSTAPGQASPVDEPIPGFNVRWTPAGICVVELDYFADPVKRTPEWLADARRAYPSHRDFRREFLRDWTSPAGDVFYPEWHLNGGDELYVRPSPGIIDAPVVRGWDFGFRMPSCVWLQRSPVSGRVFVLRSIMPQDIDTWSFRDLVMYLSGQVGIEMLGPRALTWVKKIADDPRLPSPPWFETAGATPLRFLDFAGQEAVAIKATVDQDTKERTDAQVLEAAGIVLQVYSGPVKARETIVRKLLQVQPDGWPGLLVDPANPLIIDGFHGGYSYPKGTTANPQPTDPLKDGYYEHTHDALGYALVGVVPVVDVRARPRETVYVDRKPFDWQPGNDNDMGWLETLKGRP